MTTSQNRTRSLILGDNENFRKSALSARIGLRLGIRSILAAMSGQQPEWDQLDTARDVLIHRLSDLGVRRVEFVTSFVEPFQSSVWLCVSSDAERDALLARPDLLEVIQSILQSNQLDASPIRSAEAQSQETVDRDFDGSWFYALR